MRICIISHESSAWGAVSCTIKKHRAVQSQFYSAPDMIRFSDFDLIVYIGFFPTAIVREIQIPAECKQRDIPNSVEYLFVRMLPHGDPAEPNCWEFIPLPAKQKNDPHSIRAASVSPAAFQEQVENLQQRGVKIDQIFLTHFFFVTSSSPMPVNMRRRENGKSPITFRRSRFPVSMSLSGNAPKIRLSIRFFRSIFLLPGSISALLTERPICI